MLPAFPEKRPQSKTKRKGAVSLPGGAALQIPKEFVMTTKPPIVLVIEDEPAIADNIAFALEAENFGVVCCSTGKEGVDRAKQGDIALIILDVGLPDISGLEVCKIIREKENIPLLFLTARSDEVDRILGLELGADDYVTKPFSPRELVARVRAILRRAPNHESRGALSPTLSHDNNKIPLTINSDRREVTYFGTRIELSFYEFEIVRLLRSRPGWVFSRHMIISSLWEDPGMVTERTVDAHIKSIRSKLRLVSSEDAIVTHRSVGYALRDVWS